MNSSNSAITRVDAETLMAMDRFTLPQILYKQAEEFGSQKIAIREKSYAMWQPLDWTAYLRYAKHTALGLVALGLDRGETVGLILDNGPEWLFSEMGSHAAGATVRLFGNAGETNKLAAKLEQTQAAYIFVQNQHQVNTLLPARRNLSHIRQIIYVDPSGLRFCEDDPWLISFGQLLELGEDMDNEQPDRFIKELWDGKPEDTAVLMENFDPTAKADLVQLSHAHFTSTAVAWLEAQPLSISDNWMPLCTMAGIMEQLWALGICPCGGLTINFPELPETLKTDFVDLAPNVIVADSRFWENLASQIKDQMARSGAFAQAWFQSISPHEGTDPLKGPKDFSKPGNSKIKRWLLNKIISRQLLKKIGCHHLKVAYCAGTNLDSGVLRFFNNHGLNLRPGGPETVRFEMIHGFHESQ